VEVSLTLDLEAGPKQCLLRRHHAID